MFGGVSGELLYRPGDRPWTVGLDVNWVKQREYDQRFGYREYDLVTGHLSLYFRLPWFGLQLQIDGSRYLAGDWGAP